ncbi:MAG: hypothetical protein V4597_04470 [Pseudomonadota bacterium]
MPGLSDRKIEIVRHLVESAPDKVVGGLQNALAAASGDSVLAGVRRLVEGEVADRRLRNAVLSPVAPLFVGDGSDPERLVFPSRVLALIWRALKATAPEEVLKAERTLVDYRADETSTEPFDVLVVAAADGLREREQRDFAAAAELADQCREGGAELLLSCLALSPIVREATLRLPEWISRTTDERAAAARVAYKDAVAISDDAGPRFFDMLAAQLAERWTILRIVSAVMDRPTEHYLAASELSVFATRVMDEIDKNLLKVVHFDLDGGPQAGRDAGATVELITLQIAEMENAIDLGREGGWGGRVQKQKKGLAAVVEGRLRELEKVIGHALPSQTVRVARMMKSLPRLTGEPDAKAVGRAITLLTFIESVRTSANYGGFASTRAKVVEKIGETLDDYVEEALALIREGVVEEPETGRAFLHVAADCAALLREPRAGDVIRRRATAALGAVQAEAAAAAE